MAKQLFQKFKLVDDENLQRLIEKRIRQYDQTTSALAKLQMEMLDVFSRTDITAEERVSLLTALNQRYKNLKDKQPASNFSPEAPPAEVVNVARSVQADDELNLSAASLMPVAKPPEEEDTEFDVSTAARPFASSPVSKHTRHVARAPKITAPTAMHSSLSSVSDVKALSVLSDLLAGYPDQISEDPDSGEAVINKERISGSNFGDLMGELIAHKKSRNLSGKEKFLSMLASISEVDQKLPSLIKNKKMQGKLVEIKKGQKGMGRRPPGKRVHVMYLY